MNPPSPYGKYMPQTKINMGTPGRKPQPKKSGRLNRLFTGEIDKTLEQVLNNNYY